MKKGQRNDYEKAYFFNQKTNNRWDWSNGQSELPKKGKELKRKVKRKK